MTRKFTLINSPDDETRKLKQRASLGEEILVFVYPVCTRRIFTTFSSPALRVVAIDDKTHTAVFDQVVLPSRFVMLPPARLVLQMNPGVEYADLLPSILKKVDGNVGRVVGEIEQEISASPLIFALFADALADLRRVKAVCLVQGKLAGQKLRERFPAWERGRILGSAGFVIDYSDTVTWRIPETAIGLAYQVLELEKDYHDELLAASVAGLPWQKDLPSHCVRCGHGASWRPALPVPPAMPAEIAWRLQRPENSVPLCHDCVVGTGYAKSADIRRDLAWALWGARFEALERWYLAAQRRAGYGLPKDWSKESYPLWPSEFGGRDWAAGSGDAKCCTPRSPDHVRRTAKQKSLLAKLGIEI